MIDPFTTRSDLSISHVHHCDEIWPHLDGLSRAHQKCRTACRQVACRRLPSRRGSFGHVRRNQPVAWPGRRNCGQTRSARARDRKSTRLNSSHVAISYAVFCLKKKKQEKTYTQRSGT